MTIDENGILKPLMLSELVALATAALAQYGDMIVWVETAVAGYEYNEYHSVPVSRAPYVNTDNLCTSKGYWHDQQYDKAYVILGV